MQARQGVKLYRKRVVPIVIWIAVLVAGTFFTNEYLYKEGDKLPVSKKWVLNKEFPKEPTALLFLHPKCPCSRATLNELERLQVLLKDVTYTTKLFFYQPIDKDSSWMYTDLWRQARKMQGVELIADFGAQEAKKHGVISSGHMLLYATNGSLLFSGGITDGRGHEGDNLGKKNFVRQMVAGKANLVEQSVYGCSLYEANLSVME